MGQRYGSQGGGLENAEIVVSLFKIPLGNLQTSRRRQGACGKASWWSLQKKSLRSNMLEEIR